MYAVVLIGCIECSVDSKFIGLYDKYIDALYAAYTPITTWNNPEGISGEGFIAIYDSIFGNELHVRNMPRPHGILANPEGDQAETLTEWFREGVGIKDVRAAAQNCNPRRKDLIEATLALEEPYRKYLAAKLDAMASQGAANPKKNSIDGRFYQ